MKTNLYSGTCEDCGETVYAGEGILGGKRGRKWTVRHDADASCLLPPAPPPAPRAPLTLDEKIAAASGNRFLAGKLACVEHATDLDDAHARITRSCQGMTMDYLYEFSQESHAASLARELAERKFAEVSA